MRMIQPAAVYGRAGAHGRHRRKATRKFGYFILIVALAAMGLFCLVRAFPEGITHAAESTEPVGQDEAAAIGGVEMAPESGALKVIVDAGHGGCDFGTTGVSTGRKEKEVNLEIAQRVKELLEQRGAVVIMTRETDDMIAPTKEEDMHKREDIIRESNADMFISIHQNFYDKGEEVHGPQVFCREKGALGYGLAQCIQQEMNGQLAIDEPRSVGEGDYQLLRPGNQASVIVECGFFSNPQEEALLQDGDYQQKLANAVVDGAMAYAEQNGLTV